MGADEHGEAGPVSETAYVTLAPDWECEVLSVSTRRLDLQGKRPVYGREEVRHL